MSFHQVDCSHSLPWSVHRDDAELVCSAHHAVSSHSLPWSVHRDDAELVCSAEDVSAASECCRGERGTCDLTSALHAGRTRPRTADHSTNQTYTYLQTNDWFYVLLAIESVNVRPAMTEWSLLGRIVLRMLDSEFKARPKLLIKAKAILRDIKLFFK